MTEPLKARIEEARQILLQDEFCNLKPYYRYRISCALEPDPDSDLNSPEASTTQFRCRLALGILTSQHVVNVWEENVSKNDIWEDDESGRDLPNQLLQVAEQKLRQSPDFDQSAALELLKQSNDILIGIGGVDEGENEELNRGVSAGWAAFKTFELAFFNTDHFSKVFQPSKPGCEEWRDWVIEHYDWDPAWPASRAYAGDIETKDFDKNRSREFWLWWLDEALPEAVKWVKSLPSHT
jgi:hypothetical protein